MSRDPRPGDYSQVALAGEQGGREVSSFTVNEGVSLIIDCDENQLMRFRTNPPTMNEDLSDEVIARSFDVAEMLGWITRMRLRSPGECLTQGGHVVRNGECVMCCTLVGRENRETE